MESQLAQPNQSNEIDHRKILHGYVLKKDGTRVGNASVEAVQPGVVKVMAYTDSSGYYAFFDLPKGVYEVTGSAQGHSSQTKEIELSGKESTSLIFELNDQCGGSF